MAICCILSMLSLISSCTNSTPDNTKTICDPSSDTDGDWICDKDEEKYGTDPEKPDTDNDGLIDGEEINIYGTDPLDFDSDNGGRGDGAEIIVFNTSPNDGLREWIKHSELNSVEKFFIQNQRWIVTQYGTICWECDYRFDHNEGRLELESYDFLDHWSFSIQVNGTSFGPFSYASRESHVDGLAKVTMGLLSVDGIRMHRELSSPRNKNYLRILDFIENPTALDIDLTISLRLKSAIPTIGKDIELISNFIGDKKLNDKYNYVVTENNHTIYNSYYSNRKKIFLLSSTYAQIRPSSLNSNGNRHLDVTYNFTIPAKKRIILMHIADELPWGDSLTAVSQAKETLDSIGNTLTSDLSLEIKQDIANFSLVDKDEDGLNDALEQNIGSDPNKADSDKDGLPDGFESQYSFNPLSPGEEILDTDGDGLNNLEELLNASHPRNSDTDSDGLQDGDEVNVHLTNPNSRDSDNDGLNDFTEINDTKTDPNLTDTDGGKSSDWLELVIDKTNPFNPTDDLKLKNYNKLGIQLLVNDVLYESNSHVNSEANTIHKLNVFQKTVPTNIQNENVERSFHFIINPTDKKITAKIQLGFLATPDLTSINDGKIGVLDDFTGRYRLDDFAYTSPIHHVGGYVYSSQYSKLEPSDIERIHHIDDESYYRDIVKPDYVTFNYDIEAQQRIIFLVYYIPRSDKPSDGTLLKDLWKLKLDDLDKIPLDIRQDVINFALLDSDNDKINDEEEIALGLDPNKPDTDDDGLLDGFEYYYGFDYLNTDESLLDPDDDGLNNLAEQILDTLPKDPDTDKDGLLDGDEDADLDKLSNSVEYALGTDMLDTDTDNDQYSDYEETINGTNPLQDEDLPISTLPHTLVDGENFEWNIQGDGSVFDSGEDRVFNSKGLVLKLSAGDLKNDNPFKRTDISSSSANNVTISSKELNAGLAISRQVAITDNASFIRYLDYFHNTTNLTIEATIRYYSVWGSINVNRDRDTYLVISEKYDNGMPPFSLVYSGLEAQYIPTQQVDAWAHYYHELQFNISIPPGERAVIMLFAAQNTDVESAISKADALASLQGNALSGISNDVRENIVNFNVPLE